MAKYFDKDFFRYVLGFVTIIAFSMVIIVATRLYQEQSTLEVDNKIELVAGTN